MSHNHPPNRLASTTVLVLRIELTSSAYRAEALTTMLHEAISHLFDTVMGGGNQSYGHITSLGGDAVKVAQVPRTLTV